MNEPHIDAIPTSLEESAEVWKAGLSMLPEERVALEKWLGRAPLFSQREIFMLGVVAGLLRSRSGNPKPP